MKSAFLPGFVPVRVTRHTGPAGPGLRVFYAFDGENLVVLLGGGDKSSQDKKIDEAKYLW